MNITELTSQQLRRAAAIKEELDALNRELRNLLDGSSSNGAAPGTKRTMSLTLVHSIVIRRNQKNQIFRLLKPVPYRRETPSTSFQLKRPFESQPDAGLRE